MHASDFWCALGRLEEAKGGYHEQRTQDEDACRRTAPSRERQEDAGDIRSEAGGQPCGATGPQADEHGHPSRAESPDERRQKPPRDEHEETLIETVRNG